MRREPLSLDSVPLIAASLAGRQVSADEIRGHNSAESAWVVIDGTVYDCTDFLEKHVSCNLVLKRRRWEADFWGGSFRSLVERR